jgi:hypothetical protein
MLHIEKVGRRKRPQPPLNGSARGISIVVDNVFATIRAKKEGEIG